MMKSLTFVLLFLGLLLNYSPAKAQDSSRVRSVGSLYPHWYRAYAVAATGNMALVATGSTGIQVVQLNRHASGTLVDANDQIYARDLALDGRYVFVLGLDGFSILNRDDLDLVGTYREAGSYRDLIVRDSLVFISRDSSICIFNVFEPEDPQLIGQLALPCRTYQLALKENQLYVCGATEGLRIVDVTDPTQPQEIGAYTPGGEVLDVTTHGDFLALAYQELGLKLIDVRDPEQPELIAEVVDERWNTAYLLVVSDDEYIFTYTDRREVEVYLLAEGLEQVRCEEFEDEELSCTDLIVTDDYLHFTFSAPMQHVYGVYSFDKSNIDALDFYSSFYSVLYAYRVFVQNNIGFLVDGYPDLNFEFGLAVPKVNLFNVTQPGVPFPTSTISFGPAYDVATADNVTYIAAGGSWAAYRVSNLERPERIASYRDNAVALDVGLGYLFMALNGRDGIKIFDVSAPHDAVLAAELDDGAVDLAMWNNLLVTVSNGLRIYDCQDLENINLVGQLDGEPCYRITISENRAYLAAEQDGRSGVWIVDLSDPTEPLARSFYQSPGQMYDLAVQGDFIYLAAGNRNGLIIVDASNPEQPEECGFYDTPGEAWGVAVCDNYAYVGDARHLGVYDCTAALGINVPPRWIEVPGGQILFNENELAQFEVVVADLNGDEITIEMDLADLPEEAEFEDHGDGTASFRWQTDFDSEGSFDAFLTVTDGEHILDRGVRIVVRNTNRPPVAISQIPDLEINEDQGEYVIARLDSMFIDPDDDQLTYRAFSECQELNLHLSFSNILSIRPQGNFNQAEGVEVSYSSIDRATTTTLSFRVIIQPVNDPPSVFNLQQPARGSILSDHESLFGWSESTDLEGDLVFYDLCLNFSHREIDTTFSWQTSETSWHLGALDTILVNLGIDTTITAQWWVNASDGELLRESNQRWRITLPSVVSVLKPEDRVPENLVIHQSYPNPFNNSTTLRFDLPAPDQIEILIFDPQGRLIIELVHQSYSAGYQAISWDGSTRSGHKADSGVYFVWFHSERVSTVQKLIFLR